MQGPSQPCQPPPWGYTRARDTSWGSPQGHGTCGDTQRPGWGKVSCALPGSCGGVGDRDTMSWSWGRGLHQGKRGSAHLHQGPAAVPTLGRALGKPL